MRPRTSRSAEPSQTSTRQEAARAASTAAATVRLLAPISITAVPTTTSSPFSLAEPVRSSRPSTFQPSGTSASIRFSQVCESPSRLITGEVPTEADRVAVEQAIARIENVRSTVNDLAVMGSSSLAARSSDTILTSKVKATYVDAKDLQSSAVKVVTERGTVYLLGRVTEREASRAAELARGISGVQKVVRVFEILTEAELATLGDQKK